MEKREDYFINEFNFAANHYRHLEVLVSSYLAFSIALYVAIIPMAVKFYKLFNDDGNILPLFFVLVFSSVITLVTYCSIRKMNNAKKFYDELLHKIREDIFLKGNNILWKYVLSVHEAKKNEATPWKNWIFNVQKNSEKIFILAIFIIQALIVNILYCSLISDYLYTYMCILVELILLTIICVALFTKTAKKRLPPRLS